MSSEDKRKKVFVSPVVREHKKLVDAVSNVFEEWGYETQKEKLVDKKFRADLVVLGPENAYIVEIKQYDNVRSPDLLQIESYANYFKTKPEFKNKKIHKIIVAKGTIEPALELSKDWNVLVIESSDPEIIKQKIEKFTHTLIHDKDSVTSANGNTS